MESLIFGLIAVRYSIPPRGTLFAKRPKYSNRSMFNHFGTSTERRSSPPRRSADRNEPQVAQAAS